ncbi:MAG: AAA family ATPase [Deltaproteobacteria bacterium]|nr:AAA family ATPase [Deltaproteobacteria bacterium]
MFKRIYIHNFRTFVNFEWMLPMSGVVVGENGAGKSALIEVLWFLREVLVEGSNLEDTVAASARTVWLSGDQAFEVEIDLSGDEYLYRLKVETDAASGRSAVSEELHSNKELLYFADQGKVLLFGDKPTGEPRATVPFDRRRSFLAALEPRPDNQRLVAFRSAVEGIWAFKPDPRKLGGAAGGESRHLAPDLSNFASWYRARVGEDLDAAELLRQDLCRALPGFRNLKLVPISPDVKDLHVQFRFGQNTHELAWAKLSDGQRLLIAMYGLLRYGFVGAGLIAMDECENYVSPSEIQPWLRTLADVAQDRGQQLLVVSHHPEAINYLAADGAWRMWRDPNAGHTRIEAVLPDRDSGQTAYELLKLAEIGRPLPTMAGPHE